MKIKRVFSLISVTLVFVLLLSLTVFAEDFLYKQNIEKYKPLKYVISREYKFLLDPALFSKSREDGYKIVWKKVKQIAKQNGYEISDAKNPFKESMSTKEYMDTEDFAFRKMGYVLRVQTKYKKGKISSYKFTAKYISTNLYKVIASDLKVKNGIKASYEIEENVSPKEEGGLKSYYEIAWKVKSKENIGNTVENWASIYPLIGKLGFPCNLKLAGKKAYSFKVTPGELAISKDVKVEIEIEVWSRGKNESPIVGECSFTMDVPNYYTMGEALERAENFLMLMKKEMGNMMFPDYYKWNGSKVRVLLNLPVK